MKKVYSTVMVLAMMVAALSFTACGGKQKDTNNSNTTEVITESGDIDNSEQDIKFIKEWYDYVIGTKEVTDNVLNKYLSSDLKKRLWTEDYDGCYEYWQFRTQAQDCNPDGDISKIENITNEGDGWYTVTYKDLGWSGLTKIKVKNGKIVEFVPDKTWNSEPSVQDNQEERDLSWLEGHWVCRQGNYEAHLVIKENTIRQYSSLNPESTYYTFTVDGNTMNIKPIKNDGTDFYVTLDYQNSRIDYGDSHWMHKVSSDSGEDYSSSTSSSSSRQRPFTDEGDILARIYNQRFRHSDGLEIRVDGYGRIEIDGDPAGVLSVLSYNSERALLRYGNGMYGEGKILLKIDGSKLLLQDPLDGSIFYQK